ncbi:hypothetical protein Tco_0387456 [Tanacetum coccineum]
MEFLSKAAAPGGRVLPREAEFFFISSRAQPDGRGLCWAAKDSLKVCAGRQRTAPGGSKGPVCGCDRLVSRAKVIESQVMAALVPVAPEVGAAAIASPVGMLELDTHSSSEVDPLESSPPPVSVAPMVSPFLCSDDSESDTKIPKRHVSPITSTPETPTALVLPAPSAVVAPSSEFPLAPDIPIGRLYRTHPGRPCRVLITRKLVRPLPSHRLALRTLRCSKAYLRWRSTSLSTMYPPTTSESLAGDSSSESSAGPSRKRCRDSFSPEDNVEEDIDTDVLKDIEADAMAVKVAVDRDVVTGVDASIDMEVDLGVDVEDEVADEVESSDRGTIEVGVNVVGGIDISDGMLMPDALERLEQRELEARSLIDGGERAILLEQVASLERSNARLRGTMMMERARADRFWRCVSFMDSDIRQIRRFCYYDRMRFRRLETFTARRLGFRP